MSRFMSNVLQYAIAALLPLKSSSASTNFAVMGTGMSNQVFVDCLDVTFSPDEVPEPEINALLLSAGFDPAYTKGDGKLYRTPGKLCELPLYVF